MGRRGDLADPTDTKIRAQVRNVLSSHWVDLQKTSFLCARGVLRLAGQIDRRDRSAAPLDATKLECIERDLTGLRGVKRVHFDFANWRRSESGGWRPASLRGAGPHARDEDGEGRDAGDDAPDVGPL